MLNKYLIGVFFCVCLLMTAHAVNKLPSVLGTCASPSELALRCLGEWACRHAIRLDLRCLLNLNGNPLLGGLLGGTGLIPGAGGAGLVPGAGGAGTGILGGLLGGGGGGGGAAGGAGTGILGGLLGR